MVVKERSPNLRAVLFDLDGVITDTAEFHFLAWQELAATIGLEFTRKMNEALKGVSRTESLKIILSHAGVALSPDDERKLADKKNQRYVELLSELSPADVLPGIHDLLSELAAAQIPACIASASKNAPYVIERLGIGHLFRAIIDGNSVTKSKPDPEVFLKAAEACDVYPSQCIGVEDAASGIQAIKAANMLAVGVGDARVLAQADYVVSSTAELSLILFNRLADGELGARRQGAVPGMVANAAS
jgi:beta-phosphoglucomutase